MPLNSGAHSADMDYLVRQAMNTSYQLSSLLAPPVYLTYILSMRGRGAFTTNRLLRATWVGGVIGSGAGGGLAYARYAHSGDPTLRLRRIKIAYNADRIRRDDYVVISSLLLGVLTPALLWKRANIFNLILGGAGIGSSIGLLTHYVRCLTGYLLPSVASEPEP